MINTDVFFFFFFCNLKPSVVGQQMGNLHLKETLQLCLNSQKTIRFTVFFSLYEYVTFPEFYSTCVDVMSRESRRLNCFIQSVYQYQFKEEVQGFRLTYNTFS